jgi:hypothetical protein
MPAVTDSRTTSEIERASGAVDCRDGMGISGSGASRSASRNEAERRRPPSPSVIEWWSFWIMAPRPPSSPSTRVNCHSGRPRSKGSADSTAARSSTARSSKAPAPPPCGRGSRGRTARRRPTTGSPTRPGLADPLTQPGDGLDCEAHAVPEPLGVGGAVEERDVGERRPQDGVELERPHQRLLVAHALLERDGGGHAETVSRPPLVGSLGRRGPRARRPAARAVRGGRDGGLRRIGRSLSRALASEGRARGQRKDVHSAACSAAQDVHRDGPRPPTASVLRPPCLGGGRCRTVELSAPAGRRGR